MAQMIHLQPKSRFFGLGQVAARLVLALLAAAMLASLIPASRTQQMPVAKTQAEDTDLLLYQAIIRRMRTGESYYSAATTEQRQRGYPLQPFVTVRLPTLASIIAYMGDWGAKLMLLGIWASAIWTWHRRLRAYIQPQLWAHLGAALLFNSIGPITKTHYVTVHEFWAGGLVTLSLGLYRPERWLPSALLAAGALMIREHSLPYVLIMAALAFWHRRWRETAGWITIVLGFSLALLAHRQMVTALIVPTDRISVGWAEFAGIAGALTYYLQTSWLRLLPDFLGYPLIVLSFFGWLAWPNRLAQITSLILLGYAAMFMLVGRPDTFYWGFIVGPLMGMGLIFLRIAIPDLVRAAWPRKLDLAVR